MIVAFEGIDCSGKTTQSLILNAQLNAMGFHSNVSMTFSSPAGEYLSKYISETHVTSKEAGLLFAAEKISRCKYILSNNQTPQSFVILDRWVLSSLVYQTIQGASTDFIEYINNDIPRPDLTIIIDIPAELSYQRSKIANRDEPNIDFLKMARKKYLSYSDKENIHVLDGNTEEISLSEKILKIISDKYGLSFYF